MRRWLAVVLGLVAGAASGATAAWAAGDGPAAGPARWAWLADTYWYVPTAYLPAVQLDLSTFAVSAVRDQTVYHIDSYRLGFLSGWVAVQLDTGGKSGGEPSCFRLVGSVTPAGSLSLAFTPLALPTKPTIGTGTMRFQNGTWAMELQMSSALLQQITHWAEMERCRPGQPCWTSLPSAGVPLKKFLAPCVPETP